MQSNTIWFIIILLIMVVITILSVFDIITGMLRVILMGSVVAFIVPLVAFYFGERFLPDEKEESKQGTGDED